MALARVLVAALVLSSLCYASPQASAPKVSLSLYYETLCPYCSRFIVNYLRKIFEDGLITIVDLNLIPYGNARVGSNNTISCQHGKYECLLNTVEACAIDAWPDVNEHFNFIYCVEQLVVEKKYTEWESCFSKTGLESNAVMNCYKSDYGKKLELQYAAQTDALQPPHKYVPWVTVDGQPLETDYQNFETYVCNAYKGDLPKVCELLPLTLSPKLVKPKANQVSYADGAIISEPMKKKREMEIDLLIWTPSK